MSLPISAFVEDARKLDGLRDSCQTCRTAQLASQHKSAGAGWVACDQSTHPAPHVILQVTADLVPIFCQSQSSVIQMYLSARHISHVGVVSHKQSDRTAAGVTSLSDLSVNCILDKVMGHSS